VSARPVLITGGAGFIGCNIADRLASAGQPVRVFDVLARPGVDRNLAWLKSRHAERIEAVIGDTRDEEAVAEATSGVACVFHMAAQVAVTTSLVDPLEDFEVNVRGTLNVLEALRRQGNRTPLIFASTNKVYGDLADIELDQVEDSYLPHEPQLRRTGVDERRPLDFHTPYGCSKGAADQYVLDYGRSFDLPTCVMRMSCIYGRRQMGTEDQGWVAHFLIRALAGEAISIYGDGRQVRDILWVDDAVDAYLAAWRRIELVKGQAFNLGGGPSNAVSLRQLLDHMTRLIGRPTPLQFAEWRAGDQRYYVSDARRARRELGLKPPLNWRSGVAQLKAWLESEASRPAARSPALNRPATAA
jgi:CDP-paratose 2-epimerase